MTIIDSIILGLIEGITEFLPISSTAHLIVAQKLMGLGEINEFFTTVVQLGALGGLIYYERIKLLSVCTEFFQSLREMPKSKIQNTTGFAIGVATLPVLVIGFLVRKQVSHLQNSIPLIAFMSITIGIVLLAAQWYAGKVKKEHVGMKELFIMGLFQVIAIIPGTSRSGITAAGGAFQKMTLAQALEYSFLLSIPALLAAGGYELLSAIKMHPSGDILMMTGIASLVAFVSALASITFLLASVRKVGFTPFVIYRITFAIALFFLV
jgi:undecaprenyl-diphosphatase